MKILIANHWLKKAAGSETFTYTLAVELKKQGHEVDVFTFIPGIVSEKLKGHKIKILSNKDKISNYDLILASHHTCVDELKGNGFIVQTVHGIVPKLECPSKNADCFVSISEEVSGYLKTKLGINSSIIYNGVDCDRFKSKKMINEKLKNVLLLSNKWKPKTASYNAVIRACEGMGFNLRILGYGNKTNVWNTEKHINESDLVISMGRGVLEAMACGRNVIIAGYDRIVGYVTKTNYTEFLRYNVSGRNFHERINVKKLIAEFEKYDVVQGLINRKLALTYHDIGKAAKEYLEYAA